MTAKKYNFKGLESELGFWEREFGLGERAVAWRKAYIARMKIERAKEAAQKNKPPVDDGTSIIETNQQLLIRHMRVTTDVSSLRRNAVTTLRNPGLEGTDADLISYWGPPENLNTKLVNPPSAKDFVHATPAQLSVLEPLLRFFLVNQDGSEQEVYFSDHTTEDRLLKLASLRRSNSIQEVFRPKSEVGSNVGIQRFAWEYHNIHEGDKIVHASLDLYFGSLAELVNLNYLQFLFTSGLKNVESPPVGSEPAKRTIADRMKALDIQIKRDTPFLQPGAGGIWGAVPGSQASIADKKIKDNFRQLKVVVGWSIPKGQRQELMRLFRGGDVTRAGPARRGEGRGDKLKRFLAGVKATQKILLLNLRTYDVEFNQNGTVKLSIQYVASTDNYLAKNTSDVLGSNNFKQGTLREKLVPVDRMLVEGAKLWPEGYLGYAYKYYTTHSPKGRKFMVRLDRLEAESNILDAKIKLRELANEANNRQAKDTYLAQLKAWDKSVGDVYKEAKRGIKYERYSQFLERLIRGGSVYQVDAMYDPTTAKVHVKSRSQPSALEVKDWLRKLTQLNKKHKKDKAKQEEHEANHFRMNAPGAPKINMQAPDKDSSRRKIIYTRLGDIFKVAMELAEMRDDANFIFGSWLPASAGVPGYDPADDTAYEMIYDIPISLEYFGQFFYNNVIVPELEEWTFRSFYTALMNMVTQVLNRVTDFKLRVHFGWTTFSTYSNLLPPTGIIDPSYLNTLRANIGNQPYKQASRVNSYYVLFAKQMSLRGRNGNRTKDEGDGIYHYTLGASRGLAREFNFKAQDVPQFQAMNIEAANAGGGGIAAARALVLPQDVDIEMFGNTLHRNGDLIYVDSRQALGSFANSILTLGGYYRVVSSTHNITPAGYNTTLGCVFERKTSSPR